MITSEEIGFLFGELDEIQRMVFYPDDKTKK